MQNARYSGGRAPTFRKLSPIAERQLQERLQAILTASYARGYADAIRGEPMLPYQGYGYIAGWEAAKRPA